VSHILRFYHIMQQEPEHPWIRTESQRNQRSGTGRA